jgi:exosome complex RNA-binding protein Rrp42 (RNase PH superfamily)
VVDRGIRESKAIDTGKLVIEEGKKRGIAVAVDIINVPQQNGK